MLMGFFNKNIEDNFWNVVAATLHFTEYYPSELPQFYK